MGVFWGGCGAEVERSTSNQKIGGLVPALPAYLSLGNTLNTALLLVGLCCHKC